MNRSVRKNETKEIWKQKNTKREKHKERDLETNEYKVMERRSFAAKTEKKDIFQD